MTNTNLPNVSENKPWQVKFHGLWFLNYALERDSKIPKLKLEKSHIYNY